MIILKYYGMKYIFKIRFFLIALIYRPRNVTVSYSDHLSTSFGNALNEAMPIFFMGDFNIDMLTSENNTFKQLMLQNNLLNLVDKPTNFTSIPRTCTCIDLVFKSNPSIVDNIYVASPFCSTRSPACFNIKYKTFKQYAYKRTVRDYSNAGFEIINNRIDSIDRDSAVFNSTNINVT